MCDLAYLELDPTARAEVDRLLKEGRRGMRRSEGKGARYRRYGPSCAWPDRDPRGRGRDHYINVPRDRPDLPPDDCGPNPSCLLTAIERDKAVLRDPQASDRDKLAALMYLGHWIGDLHQPLHVSYADDLGGNRIEVSGDLCSRSRSLHAAWDTCLVRAWFGAPRFMRRMAERLWSGIRPDERASWRASLDPNQWARESHALVRAPAVEYCVPDGDRCAYGPSRPRYGKGERPRRVEVDAEYLQRHGPTVEARIAQAGVRLGAVLNDALR